VFPDLHGGQTQAENRIFNYPLASSPFVSAIQATASSPAVTTKPLVFFDPTKYVIRSVRPMLIRLEEKYSDFGEIGFLLFWRLDGQLVDGNNGASCQYLEVVY
jgi:HK97 family phage major capsid protein